MRVLVTGASGFVARFLVPTLIERGHSVRAAARRAFNLPAGAEACRIGAVGPNTDWSEALAGVEAVVHLAARAHVLRESVPTPETAFRTVNRDGTRRLAEIAASLGIRRLVFVSSIGVNGNTTCGRAPFGADDPAQPYDAYAVSKWQAEQALADIALRTGLETVVLRPPLVYGPGAGGNFGRLMRWVNNGLPLPLASVDNRRSLIYVANLVDAVATCLEHPQAANRTFPVADSEAISTPALIRTLAQELGRPAHLLRMPVGLMRLACRVTGREVVARRLLGSLLVDSHAIRHELGWQPPFTLAEGLRLTAYAYLAKQG